MNAAGLYLLLPTLLLPSVARSAGMNDGWDDFSRACASEFRAEWNLQVAAGRKWTQASLQNLEQVDSMGNKICPAYFDHPNDGEQIAAFVNQKSKILDQSPLVEKQGQALLAFLSAQRLDYQSSFQAVGIDFSTSPCGRRMADLSEKMQARLAQLRTKLSALAQTCFATNAASGPAQAKMKKYFDQQAVPAGPSGRTPASGSDITGLKEDLAKDKKLP
jgi:hypothetical protein